jgi:hypothetical protein
MSKTLKIIFIILGISILIGTGYGLAHLLAPRPSVEKKYQFTVNVEVSGTFDCTLTPAALTLKKGEVGTITITNTASGGFDAKVQYQVAGLPASAVSFSVNPVDPGQTTVLTINTAGLASNTMYVCKLQAKDVMTE